MFDAKEKEPKLSDDMQGIINRCMGDTTTPKTDDIYRVKYKIMKILTEDDDILRTLHSVDFANDDNINGDLYRNIHIFDYMKLPDFKNEVKNYICFEVNDNGWGDTTEKTITFRCVSHADDVSTDWGISRHDLLAAIIKNKFDWSNEFGMRLIKKADNGYVTDEYYYREIIYRSTDPLNTYKKINQRSR